MGERESRLSGLDGDNFHMGRCVSVVRSQYQVQSLGQSDLQHLFPSGSLCMCG